MTRSHPPDIAGDPAADHHPPPAVTPPDPLRREAERDRLAEDLAWLIRRWIHLTDPPRSPEGSPGPPDVPPRS